MRKLNIGLIAALVIFIGINIFQFVFWRDKNIKTSEKYTQEIANLEATIAKFGSETTVYTVNKPVKAGDVIEEEDIESMVTYTSLLTEQYVTDVSSIIGRYYKVAVNPGSAIYKNMVMDEEIVDDMRDHDFILDRLPVGLVEGDYIDIRITMPYGDDYIVMPHKRVYGINENSIKLYVTELEWNTYQGALVDYFLNQEYGCTIYADKYIEPGLQQSAINFYAVPTNIAALLQKNPNIIDKNEASSLNAWRESIEQLLVIFRDDEDTVDADGGRLAAHRQERNEAIEEDRKSKAEADAEAAAEAAENAENEEDEIGDDFWAEDPTEETTEEEGTTE